jgi:hypothetical protein
VILRTKLMKSYHKVYNHSGAPWTWTKVVRVHIAGTLLEKHRVGSKRSLSRRNFIEV